MCWKLLCFFSVVHVFGYVECIHLNSILRFSCDKCQNNPSKCCVGTLIAPSVAISTKICAISCQFIITRNNMIPIVETYSYPRIRNYISTGRNNESPNDFALIVCNHLASQNYVKLSAVEPLSLIGLRAFIPVLNYKKPYLKATVILPCDKQFNESRGYYICTSKRFGDVTPIHHQSQGVPLLINGNIIGIIGNNLEHLTQDAFIAVGPLLSWIRATVLEANLQKKNPILRRYIDLVSGNSSTNVTDTNITTSNKNYAVTINAVKGLEKNELKMIIVNNTKSMEGTNTINENTDLSRNSATTAEVWAASNNATPEFIFLNSSKTENKTSTLKKSVRLLDVANLTTTMIVLSTTANSSDILSTRSLTVGTTTVAAVNLNTIASTTVAPTSPETVDSMTLAPTNPTTSATTATVAPLVTETIVSTTVAPTNAATIASTTVAPTNPTTNATTTSAPVSTETIASTTAAPTNPKNIASTTTIIYATRVGLTTNVMDWFKSMQSKIHDNPPLVLILTTTLSSPVIKDTKNFVDLT